MSSSLVVRIGVVLLASTAAYPRAANDPPYTQVAQLPRHADSRVMNEFHFDPVGRRLYGRTGEGVYWMDPRAVEPRFNGPILSLRLGTIELAPDLGRLYFSADRGQFGYLNLRTNAVTTLVEKGWRATPMAYEPTRGEIYSPTRLRSDVMAVYDAGSGKLTDEIKLPGFRVTRLKAIPGMVFFSVENKFGLYVIDAATHAVRPWPVDGKMIDPGRLKVDPAGRHMIAHYVRHIEAIDVRSARVIARLPGAGLADFAFDPDHQLVVVAVQDPPDHPRVRLRTYALNANGFSEVAELKNPEEDYGGLTSMHGGFLLGGHRLLYLWRATPPR